MPGPRCFCIFPDSNGKLGWRLDTLVQTLTSKPQVPGEGSGEAGGLLWRFGPLAPLRPLRSPQFDLPQVSLEAVQYAWGVGGGRCVSLAIEPPTDPWTPYTLFLQVYPSSPFSRPLFTRDVFSLRSSTTPHPISRTPLHPHKGLWVTYWALLPLGSATDAESNCV